MSKPELLGTYTPGKRNPQSKTRKGNTVKPVLLNTECCILNTRWFPFQL